MEEFLATYVIIAYNPPQPLVVLYGSHGPIPDGVILSNLIIAYNPPQPLVVLFGSHGLILMA